MLLFAQRGMHNAALRAYQDCQQSLQEALNMAPEEVTTAIYRKILESAGQPRNTRSRA
jgi:DNA-binding SARP family transcriptional activator